MHRRPKKKIARVEPLATRRRVHADTKQASRLHVPEHSISIRASRRRQSSATENVIRTTLRSPSNSRSGTLSHSPRATGVQL